MVRSAVLLVTVGCVLGTSPAMAEPVPLAEGVEQVNAICVASRNAFLQGGTVRLRNREAGPVVQVQRFNPVSGRLLDTGWPTLTQRAVGTYDRSGFILDARLRRSQVEQAARYLGFGKHPWVLTRGQFGVIPSRTFRQFLRTDLLAPDRFIDLDSTTVPSQPQRCASHLLPGRADASIERTVDAATVGWTLAYTLDDGSGPVRVTTSISVDDGVITSGTTAIRGPRGQMDLNVDNYAQWSYKRPKVRLPQASKVVSQRMWIKATDAAALVTDVRYLAGSLMDRRSVAGLHKAAAKRVKAANRGHRVMIRIRETSAGVVLWARNPYTRQTVAFDVSIQRKPRAVVRRVS